MNSKTLPNRNHLLATIAIAGLACSVTSGDTITVCLDGSCDFTDPAAAAAAATSGDVIEIAAGTYLLENPVSIYGPSVEIRGAVDGKGRPATILDGQGVGQVLAILLAVGETARVENLVITNGFAEFGGGLWTRHSTLNFENCVISENHAENKGGGMFVEGSASYPITFEGCEFSGNTVSHPKFNIGLGGAGWLGESLVRLIDTKVIGNSAQHRGGGFGMSTEGELMLDGSRICGNDASDVPSTSQVSGGTITLVLGCIDDSCDCTFDGIDADLNGDNAVNGADLGLLLANWGQPGPGDLNGDDVVGGADLGLMLAAWSR
ncbi:MAG: hypothetical protein P8I44_02160 [Phycisphaerales bacterium]|nr:hypothetical protein [Phycisphaerales bacterium]